MVVEKLQACELSLILNAIRMDMRAKFEIKGTENAGDSGKVWWTVGRVSARRGKVSDNVGMKCDRSAELPKLDVAGSIPVARSNKFLSPVWPR